METTPRIRLVSPPLLGGQSYTFEFKPADFEYEWKLPVKQRHFRATRLCATSTYGGGLVSVDKTAAVRSFEVVSWMSGGRSRSAYRIFRIERSAQRLKTVPPCHYDDTVTITVRRRTECHSHAECRGIGEFKNTPSNVILELAKTCAARFPLILDVVLEGLETRDLRIERYTWTLHANLRFGTKNGFELRGRPQVTLRPDHFVTNAPMPGFVTLDALRLGTATLLMGTHDAFEFSAQSFSGRLDCPIVRPDQEAVIRCYHTGQVPHAFCYGDNFTFTATFTGVAVDEGSGLT
jgi:hypothetical protein